MYIPINTFFDATLTQHSEVLFYFISQKYPVRRLALYYSLRGGILISCTLTSALIFTETTHPKDLVYSFIQFHLPYRYAFAFMIGLRYIPLIEKESNTIEIAQTLRGQKISKKSKLKQIFLHIYHRITTLLISILRKAKTTSRTIDARGFGLYKSRTNLHTISWHISDLIAFSLFFVWILFFSLFKLQILPQPFHFPSIFHFLF